MAKKLADIKNEIEAKQIDFKIHLENTLESDVWVFLLDLSKKCHLYIFSGVIRNYFLNIKVNRDIDVFLDGFFEVEKMLNGKKYRRNSFGGYKIVIGNTIIDLWFLQDTWALKNTQTSLDFDLAKYIPHTAFFNFSSIIFSFNDSKFYYTIDFIRFLRDRKIDLVFAPNANNALCVINSLYYSDKLNLKIANKLKRYIRHLYSVSSAYDDVQMKHFGEILYSKEILKTRIELL